MDKHEPNLITAEELSLIKIKLGKSKRSEKDWSAIKEILSKADLLVPKSLDEVKGIKNYQDAMAVDNFLIAFTNPDDYSRQMDAFAQDLQMTMRCELNIRSFVGMCHLADDEGLTLCIDLITDRKNCFITYSNGRVEASIVDRNW